MDTAVKKCGRNTAYRMLHYWVERRLGKPGFCHHCKRTDKKYYDWSNISGKYLKDVSDWRRLCRSCHMTLDGHSKKCRDGLCVKKLHPMKGDNLYVSPTSGTMCRQCKSQYGKDYRARKLEL